MDQRERERRWMELKRESDARGRARKEFEATVRKEVTPALKGLGFGKVAGGLYWNRTAQPGRIDTFELMYDRGNHHPEALRYDGTFGVHIESVAAAMGKPAADPRRYVESQPFPLPGRAPQRGSTLCYEVNAEVPFTNVCAQIVADAAAATATVDALDVTSLDSVLAWYEGNPRGQAFAYAAFGDLERARAVYPRARAGAYETEPYPDGGAELLGLDPTPLPPDGGFVDEAPVAAAVRQAFGPRLRWARGVYDQFEITLDGPITDEDRATAEAIVPTPVEFVLGNLPDDDMVAVNHLWDQLRPVLAAREAAVPELIAHSPSMSGRSVNVEVDNLDPVTEELIREIVPAGRLSMRPVSDPVAARLGKRDRLAAAAAGIAGLEPIDPDLLALVERLVTGWQTG